MAVTQARPSRVQELHRLSPSGDHKDNDDEVETKRKVALVNQNYPDKAAINTEQVLFNADVP